MQKKSKLVSQLTSYQLHLPKAKDNKGTPFLLSTVPTRDPDPTISNNHPSIPSILHTTLLGVGIKELRDRDGKPCLPRPPGSATMLTSKQAVRIIVDAESQNFTTNELSKLKQQMEERQYIPIKRSQFNKKISQYRNNLNNIPK